MPSGTKVSLADIKRLLAFATPDERRELDTLIAADTLTVAWRPLPGPQRAAYDSLADVVGYGGGAGGGKTDVAIGKALNRHQRTAYFRVDGT